MVLGSCVVNTSIILLTIYFLPDAGSVSINLRKTADESGKLVYDNPQGSEKYVSTFSKHSGGGGGEHMYFSLSTKY